MQEKIHGYLLFTAVVDPVLKTRLKDFLRVWRGKASKAARDLKDKLPGIFRTILHPWRLASAFNKSAPLVPPPVSSVIHTDASLLGWGGHAGDRVAQGVWSPEFAKFHINVLELMATFLSLRRLRPQPHSHIQLVLDNQTAVSCLRRGGSRSPSLNHVVLAIVKLSVRMKWHLSVTHLQGARNVMADSLSRVSPQETEWSLDEQSFLEVCSRIPGLQIDLFATCQNHKLPHDVAPNLDPQAIASDAISSD